MAGVEAKISSPNAAVVDLPRDGGIQLHEEYSKNGHQVLRRGKNHNRDHEMVRGAGLAAVHDLLQLLPGKDAGGDEGRRARSPGVDQLYKIDQNPDPGTWKYDSKGNLLSAGNSFHASYDEAGHAVNAVMDGQVWEKTDAGVTHAYTGADGTWQTQEIPGGQLSIKTYGGDNHGLYQGAEVTVEGGDGSISSLSQMLYSSPENREYLNNYWANF
jgi:hypothetical protein